LIFKEISLVHYQVCFTKERLEGFVTIILPPESDFRMVLMQKINNL